MKFIELTRLENSKPKFINADKIISIYPTEDGSVIYLVDQTETYAKETPSQIVKLIEGN